MTDQSQTTNETLRVAAIGDLHASELHPNRYRDMFAEISQEADVVCLCGDLTNLGKVSEAEILAEDLQSCAIPALGVLGNHDYEDGCADEVMAILRQAGMRFLGVETTEIKGVGFAGAKGFAGGFDRYLLDSFGEDSIKRFVGESVAEALRLEHALRELDNDRIVVVLHYAPITATLEGEPREIFPFLGSSRLAETVDRFSDTVRAVFHGHAHHGIYSGETPKGVPVYNAAQFVTQKDHGKPYALVEV